MAERTHEQRSLAAIMFTDMVGFSALAQRNEGLALELLEEHRGLLRSIFLRHQGEEIKTTGDGFLVAFASALAATQCAIEIQDCLADRNAGQPEARLIRIRIGLHVGDVVRREGDVFGDGVNIAARIEPLAEPGGICVSQQVYDQIRNKIEHPFIRFGMGELKNIEVPVVIYKLQLALETRAGGIASRLGFKMRQRRVRVSFLLLATLILTVVLAYWWGGQGRSGLFGSGPIQASVAVLPFLNMSADKENEIFCDGLTEELINTLAQAGFLRVASRTSSFAFKGRNDDIQKIGRDLNVHTILEGSVRKVGSQLRITAQLINVTDGYHIWSETYDRDLTNALALQSQVARQALDALQSQARAGDFWGGMENLRGVIRRDAQ